MGIEVGIKNGQQEEKMKHPRGYLHLIKWHKGKADPKIPNNHSRILDELNKKPIYFLQVDKEAEGNQISFNIINNCWEKLGFTEMPKEGSEFRELIAATNILCQRLRSGS